MCHYGDDIMQYKICFILCIDFSKWMQELDRRYAEAMPTKCSISSKKRTEGSPSKSLPPKNCPNWAIDKSWDAQGNNM